eukprot:2976193-Pleurochrysis_carterae.AAC.6
MDVKFIEKTAEGKRFDTVKVVDPSFPTGSVYWTAGLTGWRGAQCLLCGDKRRLAQTHAPCLDVCMRRSVQG